MALSAEEFADLRRWGISGCDRRARARRHRGEDGPLERRHPAGGARRRDRDRVCADAGRPADAADGHCPRARAGDVGSLARKAGRARGGGAEGRGEGHSESGREPPPEISRRPILRSPSSRASRRSQGIAARARARRRPPPRRRRRFPSRPPPCRPRRCRAGSAHAVEHGADLENAHPGAARAQQALSGIGAVAPPARGRPVFFSLDRQGKVINSRLVRSSGATRARRRGAGVVAACGTFPAAAAGIAGRPR